jgi:DNA invertase Pin-like site-specific DNA recombinase
MMAALAGERPTPMRIAVMTAKRWPQSGVRLTVSFLDNPDGSLRKRILSHMNALGKKANVKFIAVDMPEANEMMVGVMALVAQAERRMISERTKAALQAAKARGKKLGKPKGYKIRGATRATRVRGAQTNTNNANTFAERLRSVFEELNELSANQAAAELDRRGIVTPRGGRWAARSVIAPRTRLKDRDA